MKKILITGSAGFIGSNLIRYILYNNKDTEIVGVDKLNKLSDIHSVYMNKSAEFYLADTCDSNIIDKIFEIVKPNYVIHLSSIHDSILYSAQELLSNNLNSFNTIVFSCKKFEVEKIVFISSVDVYKKSAEKKNENSEIYPNNEYASSKIYCENLLKVFGENEYLNYNIIRVPEIFGPRSYKGVIADMFLDVKGNDKIELFNKGNVVHDLLHIEDFCNGIMTVLLNGKNNEIYNLSANIDFTELELAAIITEVLKEGKIEFINDEEVINQYIDIDTTKIKNLGWKPLRKFKERIKNTVEWYQNNLWFFK